MGSWVPIHGTFSYWYAKNWQKFMAVTIQEYEVWQIEEREYENSKFSISAVGERERLKSALIG